MRKTLVLHLSTIIFCLLQHQLYAQADTEFWFVAPEVANSHGDDPILLGLSTIDEPATITLSIPADDSFQPISWQLAANEAFVADITEHLDLVENKPANVILRKGMLITSTAPASVYYHVNHRNNLDIFTLKGRQALGKVFYIPSQWSFRNVHGEAAFDIVATQDNTTIEITPTRPIVGQAAGESFTITLNRGETFSCRAIAGNPDNHLQGSSIKSDKPIAITNFDDSVVNDPGNGWDLLGDQLVPVKLISTEYIALRGEAATERVYITAVEDDTEVMMDIQSNTRVSLSQGESHFYNISGRAAYIKSTKPIYVWHMSGHSGEAAAALLPPIGCTGIRKANFVRPFSQDFSILLLTESGNEDAFLLNGSQSISASDFFYVAGTNQAWVAAKINLPSTLLSGNNQIANTKGLFHLGMIIFTGTGSAYGYFSGYSSLSLGASKNLCAGDSLVLDAGIGKTNYLWNTGSTEQQITVSESGTYWVKANFDVCEFSDTIEIEEIDIPLELGKDTLICEYDSLNFNVGIIGGRYIWNDSVSSFERSISQAGTYWVRVSKGVCYEADTITIEETLLPPLDLGPDTLLCKGERLILDAYHPESSYVWQDGSVEENISLTEAGLYWVEREFRNCFQRDSVEVGRRLLEISIGVDTLLCIGDSLQLDETQQGVSYLWEDGSTAPQRTITERGLYIMNAANRCESFQKSWVASFVNCGCELFIPNVFTPNGDGIQDEFWPQISCTLTDYQLLIYDRWGRQVFVSRSIADRWKGQYANKQAKEGVYYWVLTYRGEESKTYMKKGYLSLFR